MIKGHKEYKKQTICIKGLPSRIGVSFQDTHQADRLTIISYEILKAQACLSLIRPKRMIRNVDKCMQRLVYIIPSLPY